MLKWKLAVVMVLLELITVVGTISAINYYQKIVKLQWMVIEDEGIEVPSGIFKSQIMRGRQDGTVFYVKHVTDHILNVSITCSNVPNGTTITVDPQTFLFYPEETKLVSVIIMVSDTAELGYYQCELVVTAEQL